MTDRAEALRVFLHGSQWENWTHSALPMDASTRRYIRLSCGDERIILMDADPALGQDVTPFVTIATWLQDAGLSSPKILKSDTNKGFLALEDLGSEDFAKWTSRHPEDADTLYSAAVDVLGALDDLTLPDDLPRMTAQVGGDMLDVTCQWYAPLANLADMTTQMTAHLAEFCGPPNKVALRDFHVENLIWRPAKTGHARVGLLDFQDAFAAPRGYDLASLLRDARRNVDQGIAARTTAQFIAATGADPQKTDAALAVLGVQRNLRILGVFARLAKQDGKRRYLQWIPHVWSLINQDLMHPQLGALRETVVHNLPPPDQSAIKDLL